jgi:hypothetical protein
MIIILIYGFSLEKLNESTIPSAVKAKLTTRYPASKVDYWTKENGSYVAEFTHAKKDMIAFIDAGGNMIKVETRINASELPGQAKAYIAKHYPGKIATDAVKTTDLKGNMIYEAEVNEMDLVFDNNGTFIKSVKERPID